ncbi:thioredoxin family protein [Zunongwangia sp. SCSIO 43204]|uniref:thioredoxin family protein n=1 Tax=Flavobacteriaceae TaxID=49546 RepID=UPI001AAE672F|nr:MULTISPECIES: thioredoxin family protein [Flavobacteriaceae]MBO2545325.1 thioredoxin family protein [Salegentibacter sp. BDJ18]UAB83106.1 thioredoxin family protein [Zunongwangia sp. SCSIO 43204]
MKRQIEIFTANCPVCDPVVKMVKELSCDSCEITTYNLVEQYEDKTCIDKVQEYGVKRIPSVAVDGKLLECCTNNGISKEKLIESGIGKAS